MLSTINVILQSASTTTATAPSVYQSRRGKKSHSDRFEGKMGQVCVVHSAHNAMPIFSIVDNHIFFVRFLFVWLRPMSLLTVRLWTQPFFPLLSVNHIANTICLHTSLFFYHYYTKYFPFYARIHRKVIYLYFLSLFHFRNKLFYSRGLTILQ